jgi:hypothetical protein
MTLEKQKNYSKNRNQLEAKNQIELRSVFSLTLKLKKTPNMNSHHQIESFAQTSIILVV